MSWKRQEFMSNIFTFLLYYTSTYHTEYAIYRISFSAQSTLQILN